MAMMLFRRLAARLCAAGVLCSAGLLSSAGFLCTAELSSIPMLAQTPDDAVGHGIPSPQSQLDRLTKDLGLTQEQQKKLLPILQDGQKKMIDLQKSGGDRQEMRVKRLEIRQDEQDRIKPLLTQDQRDKYVTNIESTDTKSRGPQPSQSRQNDGSGAPPH